MTTRRLGSRTRSSGIHGQQDEGPAAAAPTAYTVNLDEDPDVRKLLDNIGAIFDEPTLFTNSGADVAVAAGNSSAVIKPEEMKARLTTAALVRTDVERTTVAVVAVSAPRIPASQGQVRF